MANNGFTSLSGGLINPEIPAQQLDGFVVRLTALAATAQVVTPVAPADSVAMVNHSSDWVRATFTTAATLTGNKTMLLAPNGGRGAMSFDEANPLISVSLAPVVVAPAVGSVTAVSALAGSTTTAADGVINVSFLEK